MIEYAVLALEVKQIVICGHSDCGAMKGLLHPEALTQLPTVSAWLKSAEAALSIVKARDSAADVKAVLGRLIEENVLLQLSHLHTHPSVAGRLAQGKLAVHGWVYDIGPGQVNVHDVNLNRFVPLGY